MKVRKEVMNMDKKMKSCFEPHVVMHSLFGLGIGLLVSALIPALSSIWVGAVIIVVALALDMMRKS